MSLYEKIKADGVSALKARDSFRRTVLTTLRGECERVSKEPTDDQVIKVIKKSIEGLEDRIKRLSEESNQHHDVMSEMTILEDYLPTPLSEDALKQIIQNFILTTVPVPKQGDVMKHLTANYAGRYDGKRASELVKATLA